MSEKDFRRCCVAFGVLIFLEIDFIICQFIKSPMSQIVFQRIWINIEIVFDLWFSIVRGMLTSILQLLGLI